ncbi:MAG: 30S ribosomal protein S13 [Nanoarchaeota archaeon]
MDIQVNQQKEKEDLGLIRILSKDIEGRNNVYVGLTKIKGVSWSFANAVCRILKIDKNRKIGSLSEEEIKKISDFIKNPKIPVFLMNRKFDIGSGETKHSIGTDLELQKEFDIKRLKKIKSYRGVRHAAGQPVRGQKTRSHFREKNRKVVGVKKNINAKKK